MPKAVTEHNVQGLILLAQDWRPEFLTPVGIAPESSTYTQTGPRPGQVDPQQSNTRLVLEASGEQATEIDLEVQRPGLPGTSYDAVSVGYRLPTETTEAEYRLHRGAPWLNGWIAAEWSDSITWPVFDMCVLPVSGTVILIRASDAAEVARARVYDYATHTWGAAIEIPDSSFSQVSAIWAAVTVVALPDDSAIAIVIEPTTRDIFTYRSDDRGVTWLPHQTPTGAVGPNTTDRAQSAYSRNAILLIEQDTGVADTIRQHASPTLGLSFELVEDAASIGDHIQLQALPSGGFILAYIDSADLPAVRLLGTAYTKISDAAEIAVDVSRTIADIGLVVEDNGVAWIFGRRIAGGDGEATQIWRSGDGGNSWVLLGDDLVCAYSSGAGVGAPFITNFACTASRGDVILAHNWNAQIGNEDGSIGTCFFGGWSSVMAGSTAGVLSATNPQIVAFGDFDSDSGRCGIPIELPSDQGWGAPGAGAVALVPPGEVEWDTTANTRYAETNGFGTSAGVSQVVQFEGKITVGTGSSTTTEVGVEIVTGDGVTSRFLAVRFDDANNRVRFVDVGGAVTLFDVVHDFGVTGFFEFVALVQNSTVCQIAYRTTRTSGWVHRIEALTDDGAATNQIRVGNIASGTNTSRWRQFHIGARNSTITTGFGYRFNGPQSVQPIGIRNTGTTLGPTRLAATRGPGLTLDTFNCAPVFDFGIDKIFPTTAPSPGSPWRSADKAEQIIVMDQGEQGMLGPVWGASLFMADCNFRTAFLESSDTGAGWDARGTWDGAAGFVALEYERNGEWLRPDTAGAGVTPGRLLQRNEITAAGGYALLDGTHPVTVVQDGAGRWDSTPWAGMKPNLRVELVGGEGTDGTVDLVIPRGVLLYTFPGAVPTEFPRFWRIRIPANQVTPDSFYQIGTALLGSINIYGKRTSSGWSHERTPNVTRSRSRRGTIRQREEGPLPRQWTIGWSDGVALGKVRSEDPNFVTGGAAQPRGVARDVAWLLHGLFEELRSGEIPCVAVQEGSGATMLTDRTLYMYGLLSSGLQSVVVSGVDGTNEFERIETVTLDEQV